MSRLGFGVIFVFCVYRGVYLAIYCYQEKDISRSQGRSSCALAAEITDKKIKDDLTGKTHRPSKKPLFEISYKIFYPPQFLDGIHDPEELWNKVEAFEDFMAEKRFKGHPTDEEKNERSLAAREAYKNCAVTSRKITIALIIEFNREQNEEIIKRYIDRYFFPRSLCVTVGFHWEEHNPRAYLLVPTRGLESDTFSPRKNRDFNSRQELRIRRQMVADIINEIAHENDINIRVDSRSLKAQGVKLLPTRHVGRIFKTPQKMHERIFQENLEIQEKNLQICLESPYELLKFIATQRAFVGKKDIEDEAYKRTEGTSVEAKLLLERVEDWLKNLPQNDPVLFGSLKENPAFKKLFP